MDISGNFTFDAPREMVWKALQDPNVLGSIMPGGQGFEQVGENQFAGVLQIKVGPVQGTFQGQIELSDVKPPESYQIQVDGKGAPGFVKATGNLHLEARDGQTYMDYAGQAQIGGRIASVGQRLLDTSARSIIRQSLDGLNEYLKVQVAQQAQVQQPAAVPSASVPATAQAPMAAAPIAAYKPPSQTQLALNVARDVFNDLIPASYRPVAIGAVVVLVLLLIWLIFLR
ncbi:MAG TPA: carbon monoxide dehydrogenase subunit G [Aggregatilineales bacterium]|nr:carbon monoxide dehydrogenase subunit G [Aggregatilineales bacterium]